MIPSDILFVCECSPALRTGTTTCESMRMAAEELVSELPQGCRVGILNYSNTPGAVKWVWHPSDFDARQMFDFTCGMPNLYHALSELPRICADSPHVIVIVLTFCGASDNSIMLTKETADFLRNRCTGAVVYGLDSPQCNMLAFPVDNSATFQAGKVADSDRLRMFIKAMLSREFMPDPETRISEQTAGTSAEKPATKNQEHTSHEEDPFA